MWLCVVFCVVLICVCCAEYAAPVPIPRKAPASPKRAPLQRDPAALAAAQAAREAAILERDLPLVAQALAWATSATPGDALPLPSASVLGLEAARDAVVAAGCSCEVRGCSLVVPAAEAEAEAPRRKRGDK